MPSYRGYRFPPEIISHPVWLYHRFSLSFRDVEVSEAFTSDPDRLARFEREAKVLASLNHPNIGIYGLEEAEGVKAVHGVVKNLFRVGRHLLRSPHHRLLRTQAFVERDAVTGAC